MTHVGEFLGTLREGFQRTCIRAAKIQNDSI